MPRNNSHEFHNDDNLLYIFMTKISSMKIHIETEVHGFPKQKSLVETFWSWSGEDTEDTAIIIQHLVVPIYPFRHSLAELIALIIFSE